MILSTTPNFLRPLPRFSLFKPVFGHVFTRNFTSKKKPISFVPHQFSPEEAAKKFSDENKKRLFAPKSLESSQLSASEGNPLRKTLLPFFGVDSTITKTTYVGRYGFNETEIYLSNGKIKTRTKINWHSIDGELQKKIYRPQNKDMLIYGGFSYPSHLMEEALSEWEFTSLLLTFEMSKVETDVIVDPFLKRACIAYEVGRKRIFSQERQRVKQEIYERTGCDHTDVTKCDVHMKSLQLADFLLPAFVLKYPSSPPQVIAAFNLKAPINGPGALSMLKCVSVSAVTTIALALFFPQASIPIRIGFALSSTCLTGIWAKYGRQIQNDIQECNIQREKEENESIAETIMDKARRQATWGDMEGTSSQSMQGKNLHVSAITFEVLGLDSNEPLNENMVNKAFRKKIWEVHPDCKNGSEKKTQQLVEARNRLLQALKPTNPYSTPGKRCYSTYKERIKLPPRSIYQCKRIIKRR
jgi:hypothetical protein